MKTLIPIPSIGRIVLYVLSADDAKFIGDRRARAESIGLGGGNPVQAGEIYPAVIVRHWGGDQPTPETAVNLKVLLDGADNIWVTSRCHDVSKVEGTFHWPSYPTPLQKLESRPFQIRELEICQNGKCEKVRFVCADHHVFEPLPPIGEEIGIIIPAKDFEEASRLGLALCYQIEACGASPELTKAGEMAIALNDFFKGFRPQLVPTGDVSTFPGNLGS